MGTQRPNASERRLSRVRALRAEFFPDELSFDEQLAIKDDRIAALEREVEVLQLQLERQRPVAEQSPPASNKTASKEHRSNHSPG